MSLSEKLDAWYDRQSWTMLCLVAVSPLLLIAAGCLVVAVIFG